METIKFFVSLKVEITHSYNFLEVDFIFLSNWRIHLHQWLLLWPKFPYSEGWMLAQYKITKLMRNSGKVSLVQHCIVIICVLWELVV